MIFGQKGPAFYPVLTRFWASQRRYLYNQISPLPREHCAFASVGSHRNLLEIYQFFMNFFAYCLPRPAVLTPMSHSMVADNTNDDLDVTFRPEEWICKGKDYVSAPLFVLLARTEHETVPPAFQSFYPSSSLSIDSFTRFPLPRSSYALSSYSSPRWFSSDKPTERRYANIQPRVSESY